eukprot:6161752-Prymnesium_polylepis.1
MLHGRRAAARGGAGGPLGARPNQGAAGACATAQPRPVCRRDGGRRRARSGHLLHGLGRRARGRTKAAGDEPLRSLFEAAAMKAVDKDLLAMKVAELKEELE